MYLSRFPLPWRRVFCFLGTLLISLLALGVAQAQSGTVPAAPTTTFFSLAGSLDPGQSVHPTYLETNTTRPFNFSLSVTGSGSLDLTLENAGGTTIWSGGADAGETIWGTATLTQGTNDIHVANNSGAAASFSLDFHDLPTAPYSWAGDAAASGVNSEVKLAFPQGRLYTFDLNVSGGRFQFSLADDYLQKTVEANTSVTFFVPAGQHTLRVVQDSGTGASWSVDVSAPGAAADSFPYEKSGGHLGGPGNDFGEAWLPIRIANGTAANLSLEVTGSAGDAFSLQIYDADDDVLLTMPAVYDGETTWATPDLPAGTNRVRLVADAGNADSLSYTLAISAPGTPAFTWSGNSDAAGLNSHVRLEIANAGLYDFDLTNSSGSYQFQVNDEYILKTVDADAEATYYLPAGVHDLTIIQDDAAGADWEVTVASEGSASDSLPYAKSGGPLGGTANDFDEAWLPIHLDSATTVNLSVETAGNTGDGLQIDVYGDGVITPTFTLDSALGSEKVWATLSLDAGINRLHVTAQGNADPLTYDLTVYDVATDTANWSGRSLDTGLDSSFAISFTEAMTYQFEIATTQGFANLLMDTTAPQEPAATETSYRMMVPAGEHVVHTAHDSAFAVTDWSASVRPADDGPVFFSFNGTIDPGDTLTPEYMLPSGTLEFNFELSVDGAPVDLTIEDGGSTVVWNGSALDGETVWGTGTLTSGSNSMALMNTGGAPANVSLTLYELPTAPHDWAGIADGSGLNSHVRVTFPEDGLYTFDLGANGGRYQLLINPPYVQKTVEGDTTATYFIPAGTHDLYIDQDSGAATTEWDVSISGVGAANDSLPYAKTGGMLGGAGNDFDEAWMPVALGESVALNLSTTLTGTVGDSMVLEAYADGSGTPVKSVTVYAGETNWSTFDLPAGTNRLHLQATGGNADPLAYELVLQPIPTPTVNWVGEADANGESSHIRLDVPTGGLYTFGLDVDGGRYQLRLNDDYLQKTVEADGNATFYVPAGRHDLYVDQDDGTGASWAVSIEDAGPPADTLPYQKQGGEIGGPGNPFGEEWLPVYLAQATAVNVELTVTGDASDSLTLAVEGDGGQLTELGPVFGGETTWTTVDLPADGARLHLVANGANGDALSYEATLHPVPMPPYTWSGVSQDQGANSSIRMSMPVSGVYHVDVYMPTGFTTLYIDSAPPGPAMLAPMDFSYGFNVSLESGPHTFISDQDPSYPMTSWIVTTTLVAADPPAITAVQPISVPDTLSTTVTILGNNLMDGADVVLEDDGDTYPLTGVTLRAPGELEAVVPAGLPIGLYDLMLTNPDAQSARLDDALTVFHPAPEVSAVDPSTFSNGVPRTITVSGANFLDGATVALEDGGDVHPLTGVTVVDGDELTAIVPAGVPAGTYDVVVMNPDGKEGRLENGLTINQGIFIKHLPVVFKS